MKIRDLILGALIVATMAACGKGSGNEPGEPDKPEPTGNTNMIMEGQVIRMMSYNIHHANPPAQANVIDVAAIAAVINREKPDVVALQEVDVRTQRSGLTLDQAQNLAARTGMKVFFSKSIDYQGGEYGNAVLSRYPIMQNMRYELPVAAGMASAEKRSVALIAVKAENNKKIYFASTHLEVSDTETRNLQVDKLKQISTDLNSPLLIGGDFNAQPGSESINRMIAGNDFKTGCINNSCPNTFSAQNPTTAIDLIFLNEKARADFITQDYSAVNEKNASDHLPVVIKLKYK